MKTTLSIFAAIIAGVALMVGISSYAHDSFSRGDQRGFFSHHFGGMGYGQHMRGQGWGGSMHKDAGNGYNNMGGHHGYMMGFNGDPDLIKEKLNLTEDQIPAWEAWQKAIQAQIDIHNQHHDKMHSLYNDGDNTDPINYEEERIDFMEKNINQLKASKQVIQDFYNTLTSEQKDDLRNNQRSGHCIR